MKNINDFKKNAEDIKLSAILGGKKGIPTTFSTGQADIWYDNDGSGTINSGDRICFPDNSIQTA
jgi:hypothetical protein